MKASEFWDRWFAQRPEFTVEHGIPIDQCVDAAYADAPGGLIEAQAKNGLRASLVRWVRERDAVRVQGKDSKTGRSAIYAPVTHYQTVMELIRDYVRPNLERVDNDKAALRRVIDEWLAAHPEVAMDTDAVLRLAAGGEEREAA